MKIIPDLEKTYLPLLRIYVDDIRKLCNYFESAFGGEKCNILTTIKTSKTFEGLTKDELGQILLKNEPITELQITAAQRFNMSGGPGTRTLLNDPVYATLKLSLKEASLSMIDPDDRESLSMADLQGMMLKGFESSIMDFAKGRKRRLDSLVSEGGLAIAISVAYLIWIWTYIFVHDPATVGVLFISTFFIASAIYWVLRQIRKVIRGRYVVFEMKDRPERKNLMDIVKKYDREVVGAALALMVEVAFAVLVFVAVYLKDHIFHI